MSALSVGKHYCLRLPDGRTLGHVHVERLMDSWAEGRFAPSLAFEQYRQLFEREAQLRHDQIIPLWEEVADAIEALQIQVMEEGTGRLQPGLSVFIEGDQAILGAQPARKAAT